MHNRIEDKKTLNSKLIIPANILIQELNNTYTLTGPKGIITHNLHPQLQIKITDKVIIIETIKSKSDRTTKKLALLNTTVALFKNYINGLLYLFEKTIIIKGIGYKAEYTNSLLKLFLGYSHPIIYQIPSDITIELLTQTLICIKGVSKHKVGQTAHEIKMKKPADIYKGNGIKYKDEILKLKSPKKTK
ncbi:MAG TPA: 50S ribosomal protein L6 [Candidatus Azoamicus sp. OHIO2]